MTDLRSGLWAEFLKARRSLVPWLAGLGFSLAPIVGGLFMIILKDPERARSMGLISTKAQLTAGVADWPSFFGMQMQAIAVGGAMLFAILTAWVFGREFSDRTAKDLLAVKTSRSATVAAKFIVIAVWATIATVWIAVLGLIVGAVVVLPGWSIPLAVGALGHILAAAGLGLALMPPVALFASTGRGYLTPVGWAFLTLVLAQIAAALGWGSWFPWAVPALFSEMLGPRASQLGPHSYFLVLLTCAAGLAATFAWWIRADHTR